MINKILCHSLQGYITWINKTSISNLCLKFTHSKPQTHLTWENKLMLLFGPMCLLDCCGSLGVSKENLQQSGVKIPTLILSQPLIYHSVAAWLPSWGCAEVRHSVGTQWNIQRNSNGADGKHPTYYFVVFGYNFLWQIVRYICNSV